MSTTKKQLALFSDDPLYVARIRKQIAIFAGDQFEVVVFSRDENIRDVKLTSFFPALIEKKFFSLIMIDFDGNERFKKDILKIINKYAFVKDIPKVGIFGEEHHLTELQEIYSHGVVLCDYKREDLEDFIYNLKFLISKDTSGAPKYAMAEGHSEVLWAKFLCSMTEITPELIKSITKFDKIDPDKKWLEEFLPNFSAPRSFVQETPELQRKYKWLEDINTLNISSHLPEGLGCEQVNVKEIAKFEHDLRFNSLTCEKRLNIKNKGSFDKVAQNTISDLKNNPLRDLPRVMIIDKRVRLLEMIESSYETKGFNLFNYPYFSNDFKILKKIMPEILIVQQDAFEIIEEDGSVVQSSTKNKIQRLISFLEEEFETPPILLIFNRKLPIEAKLEYKLNFEGEISLDIIERLLEVYKRKSKSEWKEQLRCKENANVITSDDIDLIGIKREFLVEIPVILSHLSEHIVEIKTPMEVKDGSVLFIDGEHPFYITLFHDMSEKGKLKGIVNGIDETFKMKVRRFVNYLIQLPKMKEEEIEKQKYFQNNVDSMIKRMRDKAIPKDEIV
ncbi:hypothetical protein HBN50_12785 [Halobacteriovorax sp. GB3]|uniref:hypothetical protein n=1 Tax=Halobacteriovorax sp. GB3 TaxID=2719615 RepID=UPI00236267D3|nr:hypothetical protein [Halobacteriovorax sp. GB3]MDD0853981.1 hypothetical protein [Halobacteriovorax sp. GB3]